MNMIIHDLNETEWNKISSQYEGYTVIAKDDSIKPCVGCFGCWLKNPGECVIKDGYEGMGAKLARTEKLVIISKYTYGGFSCFVKNVLDRSISYILPFLTVKNGETHHKYRYDNALNMEVIFYGENISDDAKKMARQYVKAICTNLGANPEEVKFDNSICSEDSYKSTENRKLSGTLLLNCSLRGENANSKVFLDKVKENINEEVSLLNLVQYLNKEEELMEQLLSAEKLVLAMPLFVDGFPSSVVRVMEKLHRIDNNGKKKVYFIANMGFYESKQIVNLLYMAKSWCNSVGYTYCGGLAIGAGEMIGPLMRGIPLDKGPVKNSGAALLRMVKCIENGEAMDDYYTKSNMVPRFAYIKMANKGWPKHIVENGLKEEDLYRRK